MSTGASGYDAKYTSFDPNAHADGKRLKPPPQPQSKVDKKKSSDAKGHKKDAKKDAKKDKAPAAMDKYKESRVGRMPFHPL